MAVSSIPLGPLKSGVSAWLFSMDGIEKSVPFELGMEFEEVEAASQSSLRVKPRELFS